MKKSVLLILLGLLHLSTNHVLAQTWNTLGTPQFTNDPAYMATAVDESTGNLYVAYVDQTDNDHLKVKYFDGSAWTDLGGTISQLGNVLFPSIRVNPVTDDVWVAYRTDLNASTKPLMVKRFDGTSWQLEGNDVRASFSFGKGTPTEKIILRFSPSGDAFVAYSIFDGNATNPLSAVVSNKGGSWGTEVTSQYHTEYGMDFPTYRSLYVLIYNTTFDDLYVIRRLLNTSTNIWTNPTELSKQEYFGNDTFEGLAITENSYSAITHDFNSTNDIKYLKGGSASLPSPQNSSLTQGRSIQLLTNPLDGLRYLLYVKTTGEVVVATYDGVDWTELSGLSVNVGSTTTTATKINALHAKLRIRKSDGRVYVVYKDGSGISVEYIDVTPAPTRFYVNQNASGNNDGTSWANAFTDLETALDAAATSLVTDSIWVAAGTYKPSTTSSNNRNATFEIDKNGLKLFGGFSGTETELDQRSVSANPTILSGDHDGDDDPNNLAYFSNLRDDNSYNVIYLNASNVELNGFTIEGGHADLTGGAARADKGAGIYMVGSVSNVTLLNNTVRYNIARVNGAVSLSFTAGGNKTVLVENCIFHDNISRYGSALSVLTSSSSTTVDVELYNSLVHHNIAKDLNFQSGFTGSIGMFTNQGAVNFTAVNNTFAFNIDAGTNASNDKGTIVLRRNATAGSGQITAEIHNNIFWENYTDESGTTVNNQQIGTMNTGNQLANIVFTHNNATQTNLSTKSLSVTENDNLDADPLFVDVANDNFSLQSTSTMIDAGDNTQIPAGITTDLRGLNRTVNSTVDLGAIEFFVDNTAPTVVTKDITVSLDENGSVTVNSRDVDDGSTDDIISTSNLNFSLDQNTFSCADIGANSVTLTVSDLSGNTATGTATITVEDGAAPSAVAQDITVNLDANGVATVDPANVDNGSSDNCGIAEFNILNNLTYGCDDLGANTDFFQVVDNAGNTTSVEFTVTVVDNIAPTAVAQDITIQLDANGSAEIQAEDLDNGSADNCSIASFNADVTSFDCSNVGANTVTFLVTDGSGNSATATATVTVEDATAPTVLTQDLEFDVETGDEIVITAADVDNGTTDNCSFTVSLDKTTFTLADVGANTVTLTAEDAAGNTATATATVTITQLKENQSITFEAIADKVYGDAASTLTATASSGLDVNFEVVSGPANINSNELSITGTGNVTIRATQAGNDEFSAADPVEQSFTIAKAAITITAEDKEMIYGEALPEFSYQITGFVYNEDENVLSAPVEITSTADVNSNVGAYDIIVSGAATDNYNINYETAILTIVKASQTITFDQIDDVDIENTTELTLTASATSALAVSYQVLSGPATVDGNVLTLTEVGSVSIAASQTGNENYEAAETVTQSFDVFSSAKENQTISFEALPAKTFGEDALELTATASSGLSVSYSSSDETVAAIEGTTVTILSAGTAVITASQAGNDEYNPAASVSQELLVNKADQQITIEEIEDKDIAAADFEVVASTTSGLQLSYAVLSGPATIDGNLVSLSGAEGTVEIKVNQAGNINYNEAVATTTFVVIEDPCIGFEATATMLANVGCNGEANGSFEVAVSNGTAPFTYNAGSESQDNGLFENQVAGTYEITVTDANGCTAVTTIEITEPTAIEVTAEITDSNSINGNGSISLTTTGGSGNFTFDWSNGATAASLTDLEIGEYTVIVTDETGCSITETFTVGGVTANREAFEMKIYPNPVLDQVVVIHDDKVNQISLIDANGKILKLKQTIGNKSQLDVTGLQPGLYFIRLDNGKMNRIIKQ